MRKFENLPGGEFLRKEDLVDTVHSEAEAIDKSVKPKRISLSREEVRAASKDTGSSIPFSDKRYFNNIYIDTTLENRDKKIREVHEEAIRLLETERQDETDVATKISIIQQLAGIHTHQLYEKLGDHTSAEPEAQKIRAEILETFQTEENELKKFREEELDFATHAFITTRNLELKKMEVELEIRWKEKEIYDLRVEWSPQKEALQKEVDALKFDSLRPILEETISALQNERDILLAAGASMDWSERLGYVTGRQIELERLLLDLNATKEK